MTIHYLADHRPTETTADRSSGVSAGTKLILAICVLFVICPVFVLTWLEASAVVGTIGVICQVAAIAVFLRTFRAATGASS